MRNISCQVHLIDHVTPLLVDAHLRCVRLAYILLVHTGLVLRKHMHAHVTYNKHTVKRLRMMIVIMTDSGRIKISDNLTIRLLVGFFPKEYDFLSVDVG
jgi:hypothetical protein